MRRRKEVVAVPLPACRGGGASLSWANTDCRWNASVCWSRSKFWFF